MLVYLTFSRAAPRLVDYVQYLHFIGQATLKVFSKSLYSSDAPIMIFRGRYRFFSSKLADSDTDFFSF